MLRGLFFFFPQPPRFNNPLNPESLLGFCPVTLKKCTEPCHEALSRTEYEVTLACFCERCSSLGRAFLVTVYISHKKERLMVTQHFSTQTPVDKAVEGGLGGGGLVHLQRSKQKSHISFCCVPELGALSLTSICVGCFVLFFFASNISVMGRRVPPPHMWQLGHCDRGNTIVT